jgi:hypothetical protein
VIGAVLAVASCAPIGVKGKVLGESSCHHSTLEPGWGVAQLVARGATQAVRQLPVAVSPADPRGWMGGELLSTPNFVIKPDTIRRDDRRLPFAQFDHEHSAKTGHPRLNTLTYTSSWLGTLWTNRQLTSFSLRLAGLILARSE